MVKHQPFKSSMPCLPGMITNFCDMILSVRPECPIYGRGRRRYRFMLLWRDGEAEVRWLWLLIGGQTGEVGRGDTGEIWMY